MGPNLATRWYIVNTYIMSHTCDIKYTYIKKLGMVISKRLTQYLVTTMVICYKINNRLVTYKMLHILIQFYISSETLVSDQIKLGLGPWAKIVNGY